MARSSVGLAMAAAASLAIGCGMASSDASPDFTGIDSGTMTGYAGDTGMPAIPSTNGDTLDARNTSGGLADPTAAEVARCYGAGMCGAGCEAVRGCCVGSGDCCAAVTSPPLPASVSFAGCVGDFSLCLAGQTTSGVAFGEPLPTVTMSALVPGGAGAFLPGGDTRYDSGVLIGGAVDLTTHRVTIDARFWQATGCMGSCIESVAAGLTTQSAFTTTSHVRPLIALVYASSRDQVGLRLGRDVVRTWTLGADGERWQLIVRPTGKVEVRRGDSLETLAGEADYTPAQAAHLVLYGRNENTAGPPGARLTDLTLSTDLCDIPSAWTTREPVTLTAAGAPWDPPTASSPGIASDGVTRAIAFGLDGEIFVGTQAATPTAFSVPSADVPAVLPSAGYTEGGVLDPEFVYNGSIWLLYFTALDAAGRASLGVAKGGANPGDPFTTQATPLIATEVHDYAELRAPSLYVHWSGEWVLIAGATDAAGNRELAVFRSADGIANWTQHMAGNLAELTKRPGEATASFSADEVTAPTLTIQDQAWQLYYAARRGTRWSIGHLVSDDLVHWRPVAQGPVLGPSGSGFDRVGVRGPQVVVAGQQTELYYTGTDGTRTQLARAWRPAPVLATWR